CERVISITSVHKIGAGGPQHFFDFLDRSSNDAARLAGLNLALQLKQPPIGAIETLRQDRRNVKERDRVYPKHGGRIGDMKLRGFKRYIRRVRLMQQHGEFAEDGTRLRHPGDLNAFLYDRDRALLKDQQSAGRRGGAEHGLTGLIGCALRTLSVGTASTSSRPSNRTSINSLLNSSSLHENSLA